MILVQTERIFQLFGAPDRGDLISHMQHAAFTVKFGILLIFRLLHRLGFCQIVALL
jgi:hypothetical protein